MEEEGKVFAFPQAAEAVELRHLRAFVAVAEELNFGRAAERLFVSQPALSRQIRSLERLVGCELLRRSTHKVELTLAGEALLDRSRPLLREAEAAVAAARSVGGELVGRIARLYEPLAEVVAAGGDLEELRNAYEALHANFEPPPEVSVRAVNANGVSSLVVGRAPGGESMVLYLHGGGYMLGSAFGYRHLAGALALAAETTAILPDYRLAPEHPFPAALDDAVAVYNWLLERGTQPGSISLAGDSAGGGLVLALLLRLKELRLPMPSSAVVMCPWVDLAMSLPPTRPDPALTPEQARRYADAYLAGHPIDDPLVSPLSGDLTQLPPLLIQGATGDDRLADARALADHARAQGVDVRLGTYAVDAHVFQLFWSFLPEAADALDEAGEFIRARVTRPRSLATGRRPRAS